jgi:hypothetical protein
VLNAVLREKPVAVARRKCGFMRKRAWINEDVGLSEERWA